MGRKRVRVRIKPKAPDGIYNKKGKQGWLKGNPGGGRPRGTISPLTRKFITLKEAFLDAFNDERMGGTEGLIRWAVKNERNRSLFYQMLAKMLPRAVDLKGVQQGQLPPFQLILEGKGTDAKETQAEASINIP